MPSARRAPSAWTTWPVSDTDGDSGAGLPRAVGTWKRAYVLVLAVLAADVALLWLMMRAYT